jgi:ABC-type amino acid transport substrate-binding protein
MYGKFFSSTFTGSMFGVGTDIFALWGYVIANTVNSTVELNPQLLAVVLGSTPEKIEAAIQYLCQPDPRSRNSDQDGKRLIKQGQFQYYVVSHQQYREMRNEDERREYNRVKMQESRARRGLSKQVSLTVNECQECVPIQKQKQKQKNRPKAVAKRRI